MILNDYHINTSTKVTALKDHSFIEVHAPKKHGITIVQCAKSMLHLHLLICYTSA